MTDRKRAEDKIREGIRRRDQFLAMLSHELRNPLGAIANAMTLLEWADEGAASSNKALGVIDRQTRHMARLLDDLLEVSRVTQNKIELRRTIVDLQNVAEDAIKATQADFERHDLELTVELDEAPLCVDADAARLQQIYLNLLNNAAKYTPAGGHVKISVRREDEAGSRPCLRRRRGNCAGDARRHLRSVRAIRQDARPRGRGHGRRSHARALAGRDAWRRVEAHSDGSECGSEFVVRLPFAARPAEEAPIEPERKAWPGGGTVVIVEDNPDSRETLQRLLELSGYRVITAASGREGLLVIKNERPEIAIIDIGLPGMSGYEVARELRSDGAARSYLVALTGYGQPSDRTAALAAGFDEHLVKPLQPEQLARMLPGDASDQPSADARFHG